MRGLLFAFVLLLLSMPLLNAEGEPVYITGCCPTEVLGEAATPAQISAYEAARMDMCGETRMACQRSATVEGGTGCCYEVGAYDTDAGRRAYARANPDECGAWPDGAPTTPCGTSRPGGDEMQPAAPPTVGVAMPDLNPETNPAFLGAVILLSIAFVAVAYAVSTAVQNPSAIAWSKDQLREVIAGVVMIIIIFVAYKAVNEMARPFITSVPSEITTTTTLESGCCVPYCEWGADPDLCPATAPYLASHPTECAGWPTPAQECRTETITDTEEGPAVSNTILLLGEESLNETLSDLEGIYMKVGQAYFTIAKYQGMTLSRTVANVYYVQYTQSESPFVGTGSLLQSLNQATYQLTFQILSFRFVLVLLKYINIVVPSLLLPFGMALRIFPFTKKTGNTLIAISLGALFMLPMGLIVAKEVKNSVTLVSTDIALRTSFLNEYTPGHNDVDVFAVSEICQNEVARAFFLPGELITGAIFATLAAIACLAGYLACWISYFELWINLVWPILNMVVQWAYTILLMPFQSGGDPEDIYKDLMKNIFEVLIPGVNQITAMSIVQVLIIGMITLGGTKAISTAIGGDYVLYGLSRMI